MARNLKELGAETLTRIPLLRLARFAALLAFVALPAAAHAQLPLPSFAIVGGVSHYDLSGTGSTPIGALRVDVPLFVILAEGSLGVMHPTEDNGSHTYLIPEVQLQYQLLPVLVRPYIGIGGGMFTAVSGDTRPSSFTASAAAGVRATVPLIGFGFRAEARVRGIGSGFSGSATELTVGISF